MSKMSGISTKTYGVISIIAALCFLLAALIHYRNDIFQSLQDPGEPFQTYQKPTPPNYNLAESWMDLPDLAKDPYEYDAPADIFVIIPVLYKGGDHWNLPTDDIKQIERLNKIIRPNYVAPYESVGRVFTPYYRQASLYTSMTNREDARRAQSLAYRDVKRAFEFFLRHSPPERPIVLVGHGQGASHAQRLLADYFQGDLKNRLAVAYIIDHPLPLDKFENDLKNLNPCEEETDFNCVAGWGTIMPGDKAIAERFSTRLNVFENRDYKMVSGRPLLCVNPLSWSRSPDYAPRRLHRGGMAAIGLEPETDAPPMSNQFGAECQDGLLYIDKPKSRVLRRPIRIGGKYRTLPFNLFFEDLRQNSETRVRSLLSDGGLPERVERMDSLEIIEITESPVTPLKED